uniref:Mitochondrial resolvase Ydc2 catalytic domain-containing protein n=1 Tax=viral metagenome TaxID=1070528 RepID=A0A6C0H115_9ZZZZ
MKLISYDVGIKNLAYCIVDENMKILKWDIIDLLNINNKCSFCNLNADILFYKYKLCKEHKKKVEELKEPCIDLEKKNNEECIVCKKNAKCKLGNSFLCNLHRKSFETKNYKLRETNVTCDKISTAQFKYNLVTALDTLPELSDVDIVLIENQPSFKNPKMKAIADTLCDYYLIRGVIDKKRFKLEDIHLIAPSMKLKLSPVEGMEEEVLKLDLKKKKKVVEKVEEKVEEKLEEKVEGKMTYKQGKDFAIRKCLTLIDATHKQFLKIHKKKDDLCDCYLQAYHYLTKIKKTII